ncbi:MAG: D-alanyl-D-alanine carboxypeptidase [Candidatus Thermoplasmatota archaeon]|nr:D-alanyl-D-alanine carboxypeptidase [Candidatus Thermoplasmatota archaeon]
MENKYQNFPFILSYSFRNTSGKEIESCRSDLPVLPASNMKILTGFVAFRLLGPEYKFITKVRFAGKHLIFSGGPTPLLDFNGIREITKSLALNAGGLNHGKISVKTQNARIDRESINQAWNYADSAYSYQPRVTNFSLNENCMPKDKSKHDFDLLALHNSEDSFVPVRSPLNNIKVELNNATAEPDTSGSKGRSAIVIHEEGMDSIIDHMETVSCNYSAEVLFKFLSYAKTNRPGSWASSSKILVNELSNFLGYDPRISVSDGSGLSRSNFLNTSFLSDLIMKIHLNDGDAFIRHLPRPGVGTLKNRLKSHQKALIFAKTGSLTGVAALSGYIFSTDTSFSIIVNNYLGKHKPSSFIDEILESFLSTNEISGSGISKK